MESLTFSLLLFPSSQPNPNLLVYVPACLPTYLHTFLPYLKPHTHTYTLHLLLNQIHDQHLVFVDKIR